MYEQFFQLQRRPFAATPDPACFFHSKAVLEVLQELTVCIERGQGIGILTAPAGMGKTLICQKLARELSSKYRCVFLGNANFPTRRSLLQAILFEIGVEFSRQDDQELRHELRTRLHEIRQEREALVVVVDEAHLFEAEVLEEIRTLVDLSEDGHSLVRVILSGQLELEERMTDRQFDAINQRIAAHVYLEPLSLSDSLSYVRHRIEWAGGDADTIFSEAGSSIIARASSGVPRCLNQLADHALLLGFAADEATVSEKTVREALEDLKQLPLHWNDVNDSDRMIEEHSSIPVDSDQLENAENVDEIEATQYEPESSVEELAVFEFGSDGADDEGETIDEASLPSGSSMEESSSTTEAEPSIEIDPADQIGEPARPVEEISGLVLDLSSAECGVSECLGGTESVPSTDSDEHTSEGFPESAEIAEHEERHSTHDSHLDKVDVEPFASQPDASVIEFGEGCETEAAIPVPDELEATASQSDAQEPDNEFEIEGQSEDEPNSVTEAQASELKADMSASEDAEPVIATFDFAEHHEAEIAIGDSDAPLRDNSNNQETMDSTLQFEYVTDSYLQIQDPQNAGIVWNVSSPEESDVVPSEHIASGNSREGFADAGEHVTSELEASDDGSPQASIPEEAVESTEVISSGLSSSPEKIEVAADEVAADLQAEQLDAEETQFEPELITGDAQNELMNDWDISEQESEEDFDVVEDTGFSLVSDSIDDEQNSQEEEVTADPAREIHPDQYIEALVPMLGEIDGDPPMPRESRNSPERAAVEIEADLVDAIADEDSQIEDEIGATVLDICMDAQLGLQQTRQDSDTTPTENRQAASTFHAEQSGYDVVEPEHGSNPAHPDVSRSPRPQRDSQRPFGRLFSELRRKSDQG